MILKYTYALLFLILASCQSIESGSSKNQLDQNQKLEKNKELQAFAIAKVEVKEIAIDHAGFKIFNDNGCQNCHGDKLQGSLAGPPLIYSLYKSSHHNDLRLFTSIKEGVDQHHWFFGNMPAHDYISDEDIHTIVQFIRQSLILNNIK